MMLLALAGTAIIAPSALAATASNNDLFLGFRASSGTGSSKNYVVNLGPATQFTGASSAFTLSLGDVGTDLTTVFGPLWNSRAEVFWGIAGTAGGASPTVYATRPELVVGTQSSPWLRESATSNSVTDSKLQSMMNGFRGGDATGLSATNAVTQLVTDANSWSSFQPGGLPFSSNQGISFARWNPSVEGNFGNGTTGTVLDLYSLAAGSVGTAGDYVGRFVISDAGEVTFIPQVAFGASTIQFAAASSNVSEAAGTVDVTVTRSGDVSSPATVNIAVTGGTATSPTDYTFTGGTVNFGVGEVSKTQTITVVNRTGDQGSRTVVLGLSSPSGATLGGTSSTTVTIEDAIVPSVISLADSDVYVVGGQPSVTINLVRTGGTSAVSVDIQTADGTATAGVDYTTPSGPSATVTFGAGQSTGSATITLLGVVVGSPKTFTVTLTNASANASVGSTPAATTVNIVPQATSGPLSVIVVGSGKVTGLKTGNAYQVGKTYTINAVPGSGQVFDHWSGPGLSAPGNEVSKLTFVYTAGLASNPVLTATFVSNPFVPAEIGSFCGLVSPHTGTSSSNSTNGFMKLTLSSKGAFSGNLMIDGYSLKVSGLFNNAGQARFGSTRASSVLVARGTKPALELAQVVWDSNTDTISGVVNQYYRSTVTAQSDFVLSRAAFGSKAPVTPSSYTDNGGKYTVIIPTMAQTNGLTSADFPQGDGVGLITLTKNGVLKLAGNLADGTAVTASAPLNSSLQCPLFAVLYSKKGSFSALVQLDDSQTDSDLSATSTAWFRPWQDKQQWYPWGWEEGVFLDLMGAKYVAVKGTSVVPGLPGNGGATLAFSNGLLASTISKDVTIASNDKVTNVPPTDKTFSLTIVPATGDIKGTFTHDDGTKPAFKGKVYQKGANAGAYGYFLTTKPKVIDGLGEAGGVSLNHK